MTPKDGTACTATAPADATDALEADKADPGESSTLLARGRQPDPQEYKTATAGALGAPEEDAAKKKAWVSIELQDEKGKPVPNEPYEIKDPGGSLHSGTLDSNGKARVDGIDPGDVPGVLPADPREGVDQEVAAAAARRREDDRAMPDYEVKPGDTLPKIAMSHGFRKWETIWEDGPNSALREKRKNPRVLHPQDIVKVPEKQRKEVGCATEQHHVFKVPVLAEKLRIRVEQAPGEAMKNKEYKLTIDGAEYTGATTAEGMIEHDIPVNSEGGDLEVEGCHWPLRIGYLNPVDEPTGDTRVSGAQARLNNLGVWRGGGGWNDERSDAGRGEGVPVGEMAGPDPHGRPGR